MFTVYINTHIGVDTLHTQTQPGKNGMFWKKFVRNIELE